MDVDVALGALVVVVHGASIAQVLLTVLGEARLRAPYADDVAHYEKLLSRYVRLELAQVRDAASVARRVPRGVYVALLASDGQAFDSLGFSAFIEQRRQTGGDLAFVIGGPFGAPELERVDRRLSLGPMTLPHQLAWVVLLEQLYRAHKILAGEPYHY
jgi:23S rRNA (pseudouridine1915-N3)-methyltransferase